MGHFYYERKRDQRVNKNHLIHQNANWYRTLLIDPIPNIGISTRNVVRFPAVEKIPD